ncbi:unnamed protein product [Caretta caretta]
MRLPVSSARPRRRRNAGESRFRHGAAPPSLRVSGVRCSCRCPQSPGRPPGWARPWRVPPRASRTGGPGSALLSEPPGARRWGPGCDYIRYNYVHLRSLKEGHDVRITHTAFVRASLENHAVIGAQIP